MSAPALFRVRLTLVAVFMLAGCSPVAHVEPSAPSAPQSHAHRAVSSGPLVNLRGVPFAGSPQAWAAAQREPQSESSLQRTSAPAATVQPRTIKAWAASVFVSDFGGPSGTGAVYQFASKKNGKLLGAISDVVNPQGLDTDSTGKLWVASTGNSTIRAYTPGFYTASTVLSDAGEFPVSVAVCPNGTIYGSNAYDVSQLPGNIEIYAPGATSPTGVVPDANIYSARFAACDQNNVLWYSYFDYFFDPNIASYDGTNVVEYGSLGLNFPGGIRAANNGTTLAIADQTMSTVDLFTKSNLSGGPFLKLGKYFSDPVSFSFIKSQLYVWVCDDAKLDAVEETLKGKSPGTLGTGSLVQPIDSLVFPAGNT